MYKPVQSQCPTPEENQCQATVEELTRQSAFFSTTRITRHLLDAMPGIVFILNRHRQIVFANRSLCTLLDLSSDKDLVGKRPGDVMDCRSAVHAEYGCGTGESCETCGALFAIMTGLDGEEEIQDCVLTRQNDAETETLTLRFWASPLEFEGEPFTVLAGMDISHERRRLALERTFFHDILNLIGSIRGFAELMQYDEDVDHDEVGQLIHRTAQRVIDEIDAQKLLLAAEKNELTVNDQLLNSKTFIDEIVALYQTQELTNQRLVLIDPETVDISFSSDSAILGRIFGNMLKNALEATQTGNVVTVGAKSSRDSLTLWVHNPASIPEVYHPRIFQRDFSTKGIGRGLGTYSMKLLADYLEADVVFASTADEGTTFSVSLPLPPRSAEF